MTPGRRDVLKIGGLVLGMAGTLLQGGDDAAAEEAAAKEAAKTAVPKAAVPKAAVLKAAAREQRAALYALLGELPDHRRPVSGQKTDETERDGYILERWTLDLNGIEPVPAYVARPRGATGRLPAVVFNHSHGGGYKIGKTEFIEGRPYLQPTPYAKELTGLGYVAIAIDHWIFGERSHTSEQDMFKLMIWRGQVLWGMMVYDSLRALDVLLQRPDVDPQRVATLGMSMGSTMAWWLAALDERIKVTVDINCLTDFDSLIAAKGLSHHGIYYYVPGLLKRFTTSQINALIAPRAHLGVVGTRDKLTPLDGIDRIDRELTAEYARQGEHRDSELRSWQVR